MTRPDREMRCHAPEDFMHDEPDELDDFDRFVLWVAAIALTAVAVLTGWLVYEIFSA